MRKPGWVASVSLTVAMGLVLSSGTAASSTEPADVYIQTALSLGQKHVVIAHADMDGYPSGTYFRWEWFHGSGLIRVTKEPYTSFYTPEALQSEIHFVQVAYLPGGRERREVSANHVLVQALNWDILDGVGMKSWSQWNSGGSSSVN